MAGYRYGSRAFAGTPQPYLWIFLTLVVILSIIAILLIRRNKEKICTARKITSLSLLFLGIIATVTGLILMIPKEILESIGIVRNAVVLLHAVFSILVIGFAIIHIYLNWPAIKGYLGLTKEE